MFIVGVNQFGRFSHNPELFFNEAIRSFFDEIAPEFILDIILSNGKGVVVASVIGLFLLVKSGFHDGDIER